jgi:hypothetical protein
VLVERANSNPGLLYVNFDRKSLIWDDNAELKTLSYSGVPKDVAGVSISVASCDSADDVLVVAVDCVSLCVSLKIFSFFLVCEADSSRSAASAMA